MDDEQMTVDEALADVDMLATMDPRHRGNRHSLATLAAEVRRLRDGLPKTKDGVYQTPVGPTDHYGNLWFVGDVGEIYEELAWDRDDVENAYSNKEAAAIAKGGAK